MSSNGEVEFVSPEEVVSERNLQRRIENALGLSMDDFEGDDTWMAASVWNLLQLGRLQQQQLDQLRLLTGQPVEIGDPILVKQAEPLQVEFPEIDPNITVEVGEITPQIDFPKDTSVTVEGLEIDQQALADAFATATSPNHRRQLYNVATQGADDNILSQPIQAKTDHSTLRVTVTLDTATTFTLVTDPPDNEQFTTDFNQGGNLNASAKREFSFDADPEAEYNFRMGTSGTVEELRIQEVLTE